LPPLSRSDSKANKPRPNHRPGPDSGFVPWAEHLFPCGRIFRLRRRTQRKVRARVDLRPVRELHCLQRVTGELQNVGLPLRKRSPSGTEHVRIGDTSIFLICSKRLAQHLVDLRRPDTRSDVSVNPASWIFGRGHLPSAPKWERADRSTRHPGESRDPLKHLPASSASG
jgi:hypothetical protein